MRNGHHVIIEAGQVAVVTGAALGLGSALVMPTFAHDLWHGIAL
jgi:NAD(P)-dependent dehydrogenase (short-subunit alcohol dehydrogenase family)